jgi:hypothetical protein
MKQLVKQIESMAFIYNAGVWEIVQNGGEYELLDPSANSFNAIALNKYIDLAGMSQQEKTVFLQSLRIDLQSAPTATQAVSGDAIHYSVLISDVPATRTSFVGPGFAYSDMSMQNCALQLNQTWMFTQDTATWTTHPTLWSSVSHGMMSSTASDRIYVSVYAYATTLKIGPGTTSTIDNILIPGIRVVANVEAKEEADYEYLMRLKRSYELQQSFDVDGNRPH